MSWLVDLKQFVRPDSNLIGSGRLVLVVGPSGAGKDRLIQGARRALANDPAVVFPRRVVTRPPSAAEDNTELSTEAFNRAVADDAFALWWDAHGNRYGIPSSIDADIKADRTVVCNVSRAIVGFARRRYRTAVVVLVTAPAPVLEARLSGRMRPSDGLLAVRLRRSEGLTMDSDADCVIRNVGRPEVGVRRLVNAIRGLDYIVIS